MNNILTIPGSKFKLKNDDKIYQFYGYNFCNNILYRPTDNTINYNLLNTNKQNVSVITEEPKLLQKFHIRESNQ
jgi:hypothetical protein